MINFKIENPELAINIIGNNKVEDGDTFAKDWYVYRNGKRVRKYYTSNHYLKRLWPPNLERLSWIENLRWKAYQRSDIHKANLKDILFEIKNAGGFAHAKLEDDKHKDKVWLYKVSSFKGRYFYNFSWEKEDVELINLHLGQRLHKLSMYSSTVNRRLTKLNKALQSSLEEVVRNKRSKSAKNIIHRINGRTYGIKLSYDDFDEPVLEVVFWPEHGYWNEITE